MSPPGRPKGEFRSAQHEGTPVNARIAVLVSARLDPVSGRETRNRNDALAATLALGLFGPAAVRLLHVGSMSDAVARDYLALGAPTIDLIEPGAEGVQGIVPVLCEALAATPLVLTGMRANDGYGSGVLPFELAAAMQRPLINGVIAVEAIGSAWVVTQALPKGARRRLKVDVPVVLAISPAPLPLRHSHADRMAGQVLRRLLAAPITPSALASQEQRVPAARRLKLLEARVAQSGHARMQAAVGSAASSGGIVISTGSPEDKARAVLHYLRGHALVNF
jgi:electron transfer flavoprotein beta subunit